MSFLTQIFGGKKIDPIDQQTRDKIDNIINDNLRTYKEKYNKEFFAVMKEWDAANKKYTFPDVDKEAHNRAGIDTFKRAVSESAWNEVKNDIDRNIKSKTNNETIMNAANAAGKKTVERIVDKSVDEVIKEISLDKQKEQASNKAPSS